MFALGVSSLFTKLPFVETQRRRPYRLVQTSVDAAYLQRTIPIRQQNIQTRRRRQHGISSWTDFGGHFHGRAGETQP